MSHLFRIASLGLIVIASMIAPGCMVSPSNGEPVCGEDAELPFAGYALNPNEQIVLEAAATPTGPFMMIATATAVSTPVTMGDGLRLYEWGVRGHAAPTSWRTVGETRETYVRARLANAETMFLTFDSAALSPRGETWLQCFQREYGVTPNTARAAEACRSPQSPVAKVTAPIHSRCPCTPFDAPSSVTIHDQAEADANRCLREVHGDLTIASADGFERADLPSLAIVHGDVAFDYTYAPPGAPSQKSITVPSLQRVEGSVVFSGMVAGAPSNTDLDMHALTFVGGDVRGTLRAANAAWVGLEALRSVDGNVTLAMSGDVHASRFLPALERIGRSFSLSATHAVEDLLPSLRVVGGDVTITHAQRGVSRLELPRLTSLERVEGNFAVIGAPWAALAPSLAYVGRELRVEDTSFLALGIGASASTLSVGALVVDQNRRMRSLSADNVHVSPTGPIVITGNPCLRLTDVMRFLGAQGRTVGPDVIVSGVDGACATP